MLIITRNFEGLPEKKIYDFILYLRSIYYVTAFIDDMDIYRECHA